MKRLLQMSLATGLLLIAGGQVFAQPCTCGCGLDLSECNSVMPNCDVLPPAPQHREISVLGKADGSTNDNKPFGLADTARGAMSLNVMGRKDIRVLNANWHATYQGDAADSSDYGPAKRQVWEFVAESDPAGNSPGDVIGKGKVTITGDANGATGTVTGLKVVTNTGVLLKVKFDVQFVGNKLQFTGFHEDLSKSK